MIEDKYLRIEFYKVSDIGMFLNIYQKQLNLDLLKPVDRATIIAKILVTVKLCLG